MDRAPQTQVLGDQLPRELVASPEPFGSIQPLDCRHIEVVRKIAAESFPPVWSEKEFAYFLAHEQRLCFGLFSHAENGDRLRSYFLGLLIQGDLDIISIATRAEDRRLGLGERLMHHVCREPLVKRAFLEVETDNAGAKALYQKIGFETLGRRPAYYGPGRDAYLMRWQRP